MALSQEQLQELLGSRYRLKRELGGGSMAEVYLAEDARHGRQVAIKVLRQEYAATFAAERFLREIEIAARLQHPHIVPLLDSGEVGGNLYLVMPYVEGESLRVRLVREGRLSVSDVIRIVADVADALAYAHGKGIIHRDIKPDNIMQAGRHSLVTDFGVAKAVSAATLAPRDLTIGVALGTPAYMAPEQATADPNLDHRVDLYALGIVAYELLTGATPFDGPNAQAILTAHVLDAPAPLAEKRPDVPLPLATIIDRCLAKQADDRWQSADDLLQQLEPLATPSGGSTPASLPPVSPRTRRIRWAVLGGLAMATVAAVALTRHGPSVSAAAQRQVTFTGRVTGAAISPDGQLLAFVAESAGGNRLMLQDLRGGQAIQLSASPRFDYPSWSADGSEVRCFSFDSTVGFLRRIPRLGGTPRDLKVALWAALSPTGDRLANLRQGGGEITIVSMTSGDSVIAPLASGWWYSLPSWSRDGEMLAWASTPQSGGSLNRLWIMSARDLKPILVLEDSLTLGAPGWDADGHGLFYLRGSDRVVDLMRLPVGRSGAGSTPETVRAGLTTGSAQTYIAFQPPPSISADGRWLIYTQRQEWSNIGVVGFDDWRQGKAPRALTNGSASYGAVRLSPDERMLAVERSESDGLSLQVLPIEGGVARELGRLNGDGGLSWAPRGDQIVVAVVEPDSGRGLRVLPINGGTPRSFGFGKVGDTPEWLSDSTILVPRVGNRTLQVVEPLSGRMYPVPALDTTGWMFWPRTSPDLKHVAVAWNRGQGRQGVYNFTPGDRSMVTLSEGLLNPVGWSNDGKTIFLAGARFVADSGRILAVRSDGSSRTVLGVFPPELEVVDVTGDARRAVLIMHEERADAYMIQFTRPR
jgi:hypothetical protein